VAAPTYYLVIRAPNGDVREVELEGSVVIGRDESADVRVQDTKVSRRHAAFKLVDGAPVVEDLGSSNGVKLDGARIDKRAKVHARSEVRVGGYVITLRRADAEDAGPTSALALDALPGAPEGTGPMVRSVPRPASARKDGPALALVGLEPPVAGQRFELRTGENVIGRLQECDVCILHASVSRQHARVLAGEEGAVEVHDLGSANGIFVEGRRAEVAELENGDTLRIGEVPLRVEISGGARRPRPLASRVSAPAPRTGWRWMVLGVVGLLAAAGLLILALGGERVPAVRTAARGLVARFMGGGASDDRAAAASSTSTKVGAGAPRSERAGAQETTRGGAASARAGAPAAAGGAPPGAAGPAASARAGGPEVEAAPSRAVGPAAAARAGGPEVSAEDAPPRAGGPAAARAGGSEVEDGPPRAGGPAAARAGGPEVSAKDAVPRAGDPAASARAGGPEVSAEDAARPGGSEARSRSAIRPGADGEGVDASRPFGRIETATAPWSPRGPDGLPVRRPPVNPDFDHAAFVGARLDEARAHLAASRRDAARDALEALLAVDPIHAEGRALLEALAEQAAADEVLARADALVSAGKIARAYRILSEVPLDLPQGEAARARASELRDRAARDARRRARTKAKRRSTWVEAHALFRLALELDPDDAELLEGLRGLERKMRRRKMPFEPYRRRLEEAPEPPASRSPALEAYLRGDLKAAKRLARRRRRRGRGAERAALRRLLEGMERIEGRFARVRTEIPNDPSRAWAMLLELEKVERTFVPDGRRSYLMEELRADLSDAFAKEGEAMFSTQRYEAAFRKWQAGFKLDPTNPRVVAGLKRLEAVAETYAEEGRVAAHRGARAEACERFREVTKLTRATTEVHREARKQALEACR
jgi:pSer/pThr/pTyr-binding forkhead associated (FHA) protein/tetratricopeptide (TPR) repeat protein